MRFEAARTVWVRGDPGAWLSDGGKFRENGSGIWRIRVSDDGAGLRVERGKGKVIGATASGTVRIAGADADTSVGICLPDRTWKFYRGTLEIWAVGGHLRVVNVLPLESYLRGVVSGEMGAAPPEALKAQSVAARTYALYSMGKWAKDGYDLRDTHDSQVYGGMAAERVDTDQAIADTDGMILLWKDKPAATLFGADCGGASTPPILPEDFPPCVPDDDAHGSAEMPSPPAWNLRFTPEQLAARFAGHEKARGSGILEAVDVTETDVSGRVRKLKLTWRTRTPANISGTTPTLPSAPSGFSPPTQTPLDVPMTETPAAPTGQAQFREITGNTLRSLLGLDTLKSTRFTVRREPTGEFVLTGRGYGHGRGMCQTGAIAMARKSADFRAILEHYYAGATFAQIVYPEQ
jgi:stage II sporulation protein D